eukprot:4717213-Prymnesium_polylepis.1
MPQDRPRRWRRAIDRGRSPRAPRARLATPQRGCRVRRRPHRAAPAAAAGGRPAVCGADRGRADGAAAAASAGARD